MQLFFSSQLLVNILLLLNVFPCAPGAASGCQWRVLSNTTAMLSLWASYAPCTTNLLLCLQSIRLFASHFVLDFY